MSNIIDGKEIANIKKNALIKEINSVKDKLKLVVIQVGNDPASDVYVRNKRKICEELGILFNHLKYESISEDDLITTIEKLNNEKEVTGILVQLPLPKNIDEKKVIEAISPLKDVDGLTKANVGNLFSFQDGLKPCTALGVIEILDCANTKIEGKNVVIVGRSRLVGLPLISLFLKRNATVTICHSKTENLKDITKKADILVVAIGKKEYIKEDYVKDGAVVIDVGINRENGKLYGDCDFENIKDKCSKITKVPGGVGPLTVIMLASNVVEAYKLQNR